MQRTLDRVMKTYGLMVNLTADKEQATREKVANYLAENPNTDENALAVEALRYLRGVRETNG